jgi:hypothetical protein
VLGIGNENIIRKSCIKMLGIYIDQNLSWQEHIEMAKSKLASSLYAIRKVNRCVPINCLKMLYYALVYPMLTYGIILWGSAYNVHINKLVIMQKKIVRSISNVDINTHTEPLFVKLNVLKIEDIYKMEICKFMYNYINGDVVEPLCNMFDSTDNVHTHHTRQLAHLRPRINRLNTSLSSLLYRGPHIWNALPVIIKESNTTRIFISKLRVYLLRTDTN